MIYCYLKDLITDPSTKDIKNYFLYEMVPLLEHNNYGFDDADIISLKEISDHMKFLKPLPKCTQQQSSNVANSVFNVDNNSDSIQIITDLPTQSSFDEIANIISLPSEIQQEVNQIEPATGNVRVRDEIGSSLRTGSSNQPFVSAYPLDENECPMFPFYNPFTDKIHHGPITAEDNKIIIQGLKENFL